MHRWLLAWIIILLTPPSAVIAEAEIAAQHTRTLRVAMFTDYSPMVYRVSGELQGIEVDLANEVSEALDRPLEIKTYVFNELITALVGGEVDVIMSGFSHTEAREQRVDFTDPYMEIGQMAIVRVEDAERLSRQNALLTSGLKIGVHSGSTGEDFVAETFQQANMMAYDGTESGLTALRAGNIDVFIHDSATSWQLRRSFVNDKLISLDRYLTQEPIAWGVRKGNHELRTALNLILRDMKSSGRLTEILSKWLPEYRPI